MNKSENPYYYRKRFKKPKQKVNKCGFKPQKRGTNKCWDYENLGHRARDCQITNKKE